MKTLPNFRFMNLSKRISRCFLKEQCFFPMLRAKMMTFSINAMRRKDHLLIKVKSPKITNLRNLSVYTQQLRIRSLTTNPQRLVSNISNNKRSAKILLSNTMIE